MRSFIFKIIGFLAFSVIAYPVSIGLATAFVPDSWLRNAMLPLAGNGHLLTRLREAERYGKVDMAFLGSSHAYRGFDTRLWEAKGMRAFNLGSSAQTPVQTEVLAETCLPLLQPRLVVFEVHPALFMSDGLESGLDLISNRRIDIHTLRMALRIPDARLWNTLIRSGWYQCLNDLDEIIEPERTGKDQYVNGGFVERIDRNRKNMNEPTVGERHLRGPQIRAFQRLCAKLRETGMPMILIEAPVTHPLNQRWSTIRPAFEHLMRSEATYVNMNGLQGLNDSAHFFSPGHLNQEGVVLLNLALADTLRAKSLID